MSPNAQNLWIDSHVHIYPMYDIDVMLDSAYQNFMSASQGHFSDDNQFILFVTQGVNENAFQRITDHHSSRGWKIQGDTNEFLAHKNKKNIFLIPGQQLVSSEGIELLVIDGTKIEYSPRQSIRQLLELFRDNLVILPWGFGKWLGKRGQIISQLIESKGSTQSIFIGDIPGRLGLLGGRKQFCQSGNSLLRGADPLPFVNEQVRIGRFGTHMQIIKPLDNRLPLSQRILYYLNESNEEGSNVSLSHYGRYMNVFRNLHTQLRLRVNK